MPKLSTVVFSACALFVGGFLVHSYTTRTVTEGIESKDYQEGRQAFRDGLSDGANPNANYKTRLEWLKGWMAERDSLKQEPPQGEPTSEAVLRYYRAYGSRCRRAGFAAAANSGTTPEARQAWWVGWMEENDRQQQMEKARNDSVKKQE